MKFFHVYNDDCFEGLEKNGLINEDTGFKIQHCFAVPPQRLFNRYAAKGTRLHDLIRSQGFPFYVDRIAGGITWYPYEFDKALIREYRELLGDWFLGFQLHESANNFRGNWNSVRELGLGDGPYDAAALDKALKSDHAVTPDGKRLHDLTQEGIAYFAERKYPYTLEEFLSQYRELVSRRIADTDGNILPCDSAYLATGLQDELGMRSFMPEVGAQTPMMRIAVALARGMARAKNKTWGTYYECWRSSRRYGYTMPCFNSDPENEWYLTQELHTDDFTTYGPAGGSSRLLQNRIYYYSLMSGADYLSEEWGLNCSYSDMNTFELSDYGIIKKDFINNARRFKGIRARVPFALVLPKRYAFCQLNHLLSRSMGEKREKLAGNLLNEGDKECFAHIEDVLMLFFSYAEHPQWDSEDHVLTNSRFGDVVDILYEDAPHEALSRYDYLIDATLNGDFAKANTAYRVLESGDLWALEAKIPELIREIMPCTVEALHWLVSADEGGKRFLSVFNNSGNERDIFKGDHVHREADRTVTVSFKEQSEPKLLVQGSVGSVKLSRIDEKSYRLTVPAASFAILSF
ncbi:MAG: hypothetical protein E7646_02935 [Ruminococcaceae bacterium]|nr:hypothetical protein [Oscillospiraceae bacterium]